MGTKPMYVEAKAAIQSKTLWFNLVTGVIAIAGVIPPPYGMVAAAVGNIILRLMTEAPITGVVSPAAR